MSVMVITGGTAGAGKATALRFARAGYHVALIARDETGLQETRQACERFGIKTLAISADVVDAGALQRAAAEVETTLGAIDVWINNAMTTVLAPFRQMSEEEFRRVTEVTYLGYVNGTRAALEVMIPGIGVIIQAGSALARRSIPLQSAYCGAKAAIRGFTDAVRTELMHEKSHIQLTMVQLPDEHRPVWLGAKQNGSGHAAGAPGLSAGSRRRGYLQRHPAPGQRAVGRKSTIQSILGRLLPSPARSADGEKRGRDSLPVSQSRQTNRTTCSRRCAAIIRATAPLTMAHGVKQSPSAPISG